MPPQQQGPAQQKTAAQYLAASNEAVWLQLGALSEMMGELDGATQSYERAMTFNQRSVPAMLAISCILRAKDQFTAAVEYLRSLGDGSGLDGAFAAIQAHEDALARRFLAGLADGVELYGIAGEEARTPTFCFNVGERAPREVAEALAAREIYVWDGDYYAFEPIRVLGLADRGGAVRAGFLHYTTEAEVDRLLEALGELVE